MPTPLEVYQWQAANTVTSPEMSFSDDGWQFAKSPPSFASAAQAFGMSGQQLANLVGGPTAAVNMGAQMGDLFPAFSNLLSQYPTLDPELSPSWNVNLPYVAAMEQTAQQIAAKEGINPNTGKYSDYAVKPISPGSGTNNFYQAYAQGPGAWAFQGDQTGLLSSIGNFISSPGAQLILAGMGVGGAMTGLEALGAGTIGEAAGLAESAIPSTLASEYGTSALAGEMLPNLPSVASGFTQTLVDMGLPYEAATSLPSISDLLQKAAVNAATQYATTGKVDPEAIIKSLAAGVAGGVAGSAVGSTIDNQLLSSIASGAARGVVTAGLSGGDIQQAALLGAATSGAGYLAKGTPVPTSVINGLISSAVTGKPLSETLTNAAIGAVTGAGLDAVKDSLKQTPAPVETRDPNAVTSGLDSGTNVAAVNTGTTTDTQNTDGLQLALTRYNNMIDALSQSGMTPTKADSDAAIAAASEYYGIDSSQLDALLQQEQPAGWGGTGLPTTPQNTTGQPSGSLTDVGGTTGGTNSGLTPTKLAEVVVEDQPPATVGMPDIPDPSGPSKPTTPTPVKTPSGGLPTTTTTPTPTPTEPASNIGVAPTAAAVSNAMLGFGPWATGTSIKGTPTKDSLYQGLPSGLVAIASPNAPIPYTPAHMDQFSEYDPINVAHGGAVYLADGGTPEEQAAALNKRVEEILAEKEKNKEKKVEPSNEMFGFSQFLKPSMIRGKGQGSSTLHAGIPQKMAIIDNLSAILNPSLSRISPLEQTNNFIPTSKIPNFSHGGNLHPALVQLLKDRGMHLDSEMIAGPEDRMYAKHQERGFAVGGAGTGQSDDIPTMLSDGEYVFDADTVSALGDGSSKAGAEALDRMRAEIRKHKRSASINDIPPKAKSPLSYLKMARKGK